MPLTDEEIMALALDLAGFDEVPVDSGIHVPVGEVERVLIGIDIGVGELLAAREQGFDLVVAHHPVGEAAAQGWQLFADHIRVMTSHGVPREAAEAAVETKNEQLALRAQAQNYGHVPSFARFIDMPLMNIHQPLDEVGRRYMQTIADDLLDDHPGATLAQLADRYRQEPAWRHSETPVKVAVGDPEAPAGRIAVAHGSYTNGGVEVAEAYFDHGIDTVAYIHISSGDLKQLRDTEGQLLVTGHIPSDDAGIRPFVQELRDRGLDVVTVSGVCPEEGPGRGS